MKLAIIGAAGRTGKALVAMALEDGHEVVALVRREGLDIEHPNFRVCIGDALDVEALRRAVRGCDAVVSVLGPTRNSPVTLSSASATSLVAAMKAERVGRLAVVTGAMSAEQERLGLFYCVISQLPFLAPALADRRKQERLFQESGLEATIVRPPRLRDGPATQAPPECGSKLKIRMNDHCLRSDLARVLLESVVQRTRSGETFFVRSWPSEPAYWRTWLLACGAAEMFGIGLAALVAILMGAYMGEPTSVAERVLAYATFISVGALEGASIGFAQGSLLRRVVPEFNVSRFVRMTVAVAVATAAWALGMAPSTFFASGEAVAAGDRATDPPLLFIVMLSGIGGAIAGGIFGAVQAFELGRHVESTRRWVVASILGWAIALPLDFIGASLPSAQTPLGWTFFSGAGFGFLAGIAFAIPTGAVAVGLLRRRLGSS